MSCLHPIKIRNPRYKPNKLNGGMPELAPDPRLLSIMVPCGTCIACKRRRASDWRFRLHQEYRNSDHKRFHFITLTFSDEALDRLRSADPEADDNTIAKKAVRLFLERYRKRYGVSLRHFLVTELGGENDRIHLHGMIVDCKCGYWKRNKYHADFSLLSKIWSYGYVWLGWCSEASISYITKYLMKDDPVHPDFKPLLLVSPGFGKSYVSAHTVSYHHNPNGFIWYCVTSNGFKIGMPRYYRNKIFTDQERFARQMDLLDNPPPLVLNGVTYSDLRSYKRAVEFSYNYSVSIKSSHKLKSVFKSIISENFEFLL